MNAMKASPDFELFVQNLEAHEQPSTVLRCKVIELGGTWHDMDVTALFEIHFMGVAAYGWGEEDATQNWIKAAKASLSIDSDLASPYADMSGSVAQLVRAERS
jgi:hypothetical protein